MTQIPLSKVKVTKPVYSPQRLRTGSCSGQRGNVLSVENCCYVAVCRRGGWLGGERRYGAHTGRRGAGAYRVATRTASYIRQRGICLTCVCLSVCLLTELLNNIELCIHCMLTRDKKLPIYLYEIYGMVRHNPGANRLLFGGNRI